MGKMPKRRIPARKKTPRKSLPKPHLPKRQGVGKAKDIIPDSAKFKHLVRKEDLPR